MGEVLAAKLIAMPQLCDCRSGRAVCRPGMWRFVPVRTDTRQAPPKRAVPAVSAALTTLRGRTIPPSQGALR